MGFSKFMEKWGMKKLTISAPFVKAEFEPKPPIDKETLQLAIIEAAVAYSLYAASLINYAIALKDGVETSEYQKETKTRAATLRTELQQCDVEITIPTYFQSVDETMTCLTQFPVITEASDSFRDSYSQYEADFFGFCTIIGAIVVSQGNSAPIKQAQDAGKVTGLPMELIDECIGQPGFHALRLYIKKEQQNA